MHEEAFVLVVFCTTLLTVWLRTTLLFCTLNKELPRERGFRFGGILYHPPNGLVENYLAVS
jgi:hypothetical protein